MYKEVFKSNKEKLTPYELEFKWKKKKTTNWIGGTTRTEVFIFYFNLFSVNAYTYFVFLFVFITRGVFLRTIGKFFKKKITLNFRKIHEIFISIDSLSFWHTLSNISAGISRINASMLPSNASIEASMSVWTWAITKPHKNSIKVLNRTI